MNSSELKIVDGSVFGWEQEQYCIACSKQNRPLLNAVNEQISLLVDSDYFNNLVQKYFSNNYVSVGVDEKNRKLNSIKDQFYVAFLKNDRWKLYLNGLGVTIKITIFAAIFGLFLGIALALVQVIKLSRILVFLKFFMLMLFVARL